MARNLIHEPQSRSLVRLMIFTCWLNFMASVWLQRQANFLVWQAVFWGIMVLILTGVLAAKEKEK